jgi:hypothetical protein
MPIGVKDSRGRVKILEEKPLNPRPLEPLPAGPGPNRGRGRQARTLFSYDLHRNKRL